MKTISMIVLVAGLATGLSLGSAHAAERRGSALQTPSMVHATPPVLMSDQGQATLLLRQSVPTIKGKPTAGGNIPKGGRAPLISALISVANIPSTMSYSLPDVSTPPYPDHPDGARLVYYVVQIRACTPNDFECVIVKLLENCSSQGCNTQQFSPDSNFACEVETGYESDECEYQIIDDRTTYAITYDGPITTIPAGLDSLDVYAYYVAGQAGLDMSDLPCAPRRLDALGPVSSLPATDPFGDVLDYDTDCGQITLQSSQMDQAVDLTSATLAISEPVEPPPVDTGAGVVLGITVDTPGPLSVGDVVNYTLQVSNDTGAPLGGVSATAQGPSSRFGIEQIGCDASGGDGGLNWFIGGLDAGAVASCPFTGRLVALDPNCTTRCELAVQAQVYLQVTGGSSLAATSQAVVGVLAPPGVTSKTVTGAPTTQDSVAPSLSADGSLLVFSSMEKDLVGSNSNPDGADIYLKDGNGIRLINRRIGGAQIDGDNRDVAVSLNGRAAAFVHVPGSSGSAAGSGAKGGANGQLCTAQPNSLFQFQCDTMGGNGTPLDGDVESPSVSADGNFVAFCSSASNWVSGDTNGAKDVFLKDQRSSTPVYTRLSVTASGEQGDGDSCMPMISGNGRYVVFTTKAANLGGSTEHIQVVRKDRVTGVLTPITSNNGTPADDDAGPPSISSDGRRVAFASRASNLVTGVADGRRNVYVYDASGTAAALTAKGGQASSLFVMRGTGGQLPNGDSDNPKIACGGAALGVSSSATNLVAGDSNGVKDYFVYGFDANRIVRPATGATGQQPNGNSQNSALDCDATTGAYDSNATNGGNNPNPNADVIGQDDPLRSDTGAIVLDGSYSGNWFNPGQNGHGYLLEALPNGAFYATWYIFKNGQPLFLQGIGVPQGNRLTIDMSSASSTGFPVGSDGATTSNWGRVTFTFTSSNDGMASWQPTASGFSAGSTTLRRLSTASRIESDYPAVVSACKSGIWFDPNNPGYGFDVEINQTANGGRIAQVFWYTYQPDGSPLWLVGIGNATPGGINLDLIQLDGPGAQFPPAFSGDAVNRTLWGSATLTFGPSGLGVSYNSVLPGYGSGTLPILQRLTVLDQRECGS